MRKLIIAAVLSLIFAASVFAQELSLGSAIPVHMNEGGSQDGDIISLADGGGYIRTKTPADTFIFGVITLAPSVYLYDKAATGEIPAITSGKAYVRVSSEKGVIKRGDLITSSSNPGVGVKAVGNGYILGAALEDYSVTDAKQVGKILVAVDPRFAQFSSNILSTLFSAPSLSLAATPSNILRYFVAAVIIIISFYIGFRFFGRASLKGVEAMGRNPLARSSIILVVVVNAALTFGVMIVGLIVAYLVVVF